MRTLFFIANAVLALTLAGWAATPQKPAAKAPAAKTSTTTKAKAKAKAKAPATSSGYRRVRQMQPTPQRYREIQQALADKGFFKGEVDGVWGPDSVDALKRFQRDQSLVDDGKLGSLSLIGLGLGPQRPAFPDRMPEKAPEVGADPEPEPGNH